MTRTQSNQEDAGQATNNQLKILVRADCTVSTCSPLLPSIKTLAQRLPVGESWPLDRHRCLPQCPPPQLQAFEIKQTLHQLAFLLAFMQGAGGPPFSFTKLSVMEW